MQQNSEVHPIRAVVDGREGMAGAPGTAGARPIQRYFCLAMIMSLILLYVAWGMIFFFTRSVLAL